MFTPASADETTVAFVCMVIGISAYFHALSAFDVVDSTALVRNASAGPIHNQFIIIRIHEDK